jgi:hypothetical protein
MRRLARAERVCRRCPFCGPSGECLDPAIKSGRCGDWIWWVRDGKQIRRPYVKPRDPRTPAQLRSRARLSAASRKYSCSLTEKQRSACIAAGAKRRTRPRLYQSGPMTGQQYSISKEYALQEAHVGAVKIETAPQAPQRQKLKVTSWDRPRSATGVPPERHQPDPGCARHGRRGENQHVQPSIKQVLPQASRVGQASVCPETGRFARPAIGSRCCLRWPVTGLSPPFPPPGTKHPVFASVAYGATGTQARADSTHWRNVSWRASSPSHDQLQLTLAATAPWIRLAASAEWL